MVNVVWFLVGTRNDDESGTEPRKDPLRDLMNQD